MKRKVIQIAADPTMMGCVYALCDDGTMWWVPQDSKDYWEQMPDIPQSGTASELKAQARQHTLRIMRSNA